MELRRLLREDVIGLSGLLLTFIDSITYHDDFDRLEIIGNLLTGRWQGILTMTDGQIAGLVVYEFREEYGKKICRFVLGCGKGLTKPGVVLDSFCEWCKAQGCHFVEGAGRHGWERVLAPHGFVRTETTLRKRL